MRVFVYFNLHRKCWSVKALEGPERGRVIQHADFLMLDHATFKVSEAGRQRVLREGRKNVHAGVVGTLAVRGEQALLGIMSGRHVTYNPHKAATFVHKDDASPATTARRVTLDAPSRYVVAWKEAA